MTKLIKTAGLKIDEELYGLVNKEIIVGTGINADKFWESLALIVQDLEPKNRKLLNKRDAQQTLIDDWCKAHKGSSLDNTKYRAFLYQIGYLLPESEAFQVDPVNVDPEIAVVSGPQLVVPVDNARYALNAANARWGSLYDAFYGTNVISEKDGAAKGQTYNPKRGALVVEKTEEFLDQSVGLEQGSFSEIKSYSLENTGTRKRLVALLVNGNKVGLKNPRQFCGFKLQDNELISILLKNNGLHIEIQIDHRDPVGKVHPAGVKEVLLEAAITTIQDCEDSVSAVDASDKCRVYRNWNGIMKGTLRTTFEKNGELVTRQLNPDKTFVNPQGQNFTLPGRSLLLIRNVGIHMYTDAVLTKDDREIPEGFLDVMITVLASLHDLKRTAKHRNSRMGSVYIVKPKLHGPEEVAATVELFERVEKALELEPNTIKIGIMDEERRTTINLHQSIQVAQHRVVFINTGFLDRTGDEIHTSMELGPVFPKMEIKTQPWMNAYENWNVDVGIETGMLGKAQIGKGMWTMPDLMREMVETKLEHPQSGASTAWVPSPTAATLHVLHYHKINVPKRQRELTKRNRANLRDILSPPLLTRDLTHNEIRRELENNVQGILGYVVRWVDQGIGCSKVPDINDTGLMEDRATLRISSQHIANWLHHGIVTDEQVIGTFKNMAVVVDGQNKSDPNYQPMSPNHGKSIAFQAALDLVFRGRETPNGYTEEVLHRRRRQVKN